jgi:phosphoenolpyruvate synthase/pyruvate phosphate dikinase
MIKNFTNGFYIKEDDNILEVQNNNSFFPKIYKLELNKNNLVIINKNSIRTIEIEQNDIILISADQVGKANEGLAEIYLQKADEKLVKIEVFRLFSEGVKNLRDTIAYEFAEYMAKKISEHYGIKWKFVYSIDSDEYKKRTNTALLMVVIAWAVIFTYLYFKIKNHW